MGGGKGAELWPASGGANGLATTMFAACAMHSVHVSIAIIVHSLTVWNYKAWVRRPVAVNIALVFVSRNDDGNVHNL